MKRRFLKGSIFGIAILFGSAALLMSAAIGGSAQPIFGDTVFEIGAFQEPAHEVFGWIGSGAVGSDGSLFLLDYHGPRVAWFDRSGQFVAAEERKGAGPGELASPRALAFDHENRLLVLDPGNARISSYSTRSRRLDFMRSVRVPVRAQDLCWLGENLVLAGAETRGLVHVLDTAASAPRSFGEFAVPDGALAREIGQLSPAQLVQLNMALVGCSPRTERIVLVQQTIPLVRAFDLSGAVVWQTELDDLSSPQWHIDAEGSLNPWGHGQERMTEAVEVALGDDGLVYITFLESTAEGAQAGLHLRLLHLEDGREVARVPVGGRVFAVRDGLAFMHSRYPFPRVVVVRLKERPTRR